MPPPGHIPETVAPGWALTITSADFGGLGAVAETLPARFRCASSGLDDEEVHAVGQPRNPRLFRTPPRGCQFRVAGCADKT